MKRRAALRSVLLAGAAVFVSGVCGDTPKAAPPDFVIHSEVRLVLLDVSVKDRNGSFVGGLTIDNFRVFEDGRPQETAIFASNDLPVTVGLLVDESYSMTPKRTDVIAAATTFIEESNPKDEVFVLNFNDRVRRGLPPGTLFSDNLDQLRTALSRGIPRGKTALNDAVVAGLGQLELGKRDKKTLVLISDGGDNASGTKRAEMLALAAKSLATIYTIGLFDANDPDRDPAILARLARMTGGEAFFPESPDKMVPVCRRIARDIRARYTIGYHPRHDNGAGAWRHVKVVASASGRKLAVRTRGQYWYAAAGEPNGGRVE
jgi:Ca-activated chloride channel homolog